MELPRQKLGAPSKNTPLIWLYIPGTLIPQQAARVDSSHFAAPVSVAFRASTEMVCTSSIDTEETLVARRL